MKGTGGIPGDGRPLPTRLAGPGESPGFLLWKVSNAWQRRQRAALQPLGLTHSQFVLLAAGTWFGRTETLTQARLAELTGVDVMTTSQVLRTLEAAKLVERDAHPDDPRAKTVAVTARGRDLARRAILVVEATDEAFFAPVAARLDDVVRVFADLVAASAAEAPASGRQAAPGRRKQTRDDP
ncbi:MAG TPA: MarR family transcriptional regulator [Polyangia bacterium]|nr:MarR family transcriptional regulator [Polyangia bacterium]